MTPLSDLGQRLRALLAPLRERLRALLFRAREERDMDAEMRFHLDMAAERLMREEGLPPEEARRRAAVAFGGEDRYKEEVRDARGVRWIEQPLQDVRYALRGLRRTPVFTLAVVLTLALGIGATTSIFSVVYGVLLRSLPYPDAGRIVTVHLGVRPTVHVRGGLALSDRAFRLFADDNHAFEAFGGSRGSQRRVLTGGGVVAAGGGADARAIQVGLLTPGAFKVLGVPPELGRLPVPGEGLATDMRTGSLVPRSSAGAGGGRVVLLGDALWRGRYGSEAIVGRTVTLDGDPYVVIGVMPPGYDYPSPDDDAWIPIVSDPASTSWRPGYLDGLARLRPGWTTTMAAADARRLIRRFGEVGYTRAWLDRILDGTARITPLQDVVVGKARQPLLILLGVVGFVLLIACANVANLLIARAEARRRESAIRLALGAGRGRVMRQHVTESMLLSLLGGAAGVLVAVLGTRTLVSLAPAAIPRLADIGINAPVLWFTTGVSVLAGLLTGWLPALRAGSRRSLAALRDGGRNTTPGRERHRARNALVVAQVALALVLLVGAGLLVRSFRSLAAVDPGFRPDRVLTFNLGHPDRFHGAERVAGFYDRLIEQLEAIPGVSAAGAVNGLPLTGGGGLAGPIIREFPPAPGEPAPLFHIRLVTPGYFRAMGIPAVEGRLLNDDDGAAFVVISNAVKRRYWPATSALGKQIEALAGLAPGAKLPKGERPEARVVGVAGDVHDVALDSAADEILYYPVAADPFDIGQMSLVVRGATDPRALIPQVRRVVRGLAPDVPITGLRPMRAVVSRSMSRTTFVMLLLTLAAAIALLLGAVGIYGVVSYTVSRRTPEIGVRLALGAAPRRVMGGVLLQGLRLAAVGIILGLVTAAGLERVLASLLYGVGPLDPVTLGGGAGVFLAVAGLAAAVPARRAARTEVAEVLRGE